MTDFNKDNARELELFGENDGALYESRILPVCRNLAKHMRKGVYDRELALKSWRHVADDAAQRYCREFGGVWHKVFSVADRNEVARRWRESYAETVKDFV